MTASGRSVLAINKLEQELQSAMDALFLLFGCVGVVVIALVALATPAPAVLGRVPLLVPEVLPRAGQAIVAGASALTMLRIGQIPAILRRSLQIRRDIAVDEARRSILEKAPSSASTQAAFPNHPDFGKSVSLDQASGREH